MTLSNFGTQNVQGFMEIVLPPKNPRERENPPLDFCLRFDYARRSINPT